MRLFNQFFNRSESRNLNDPKKPLVAPLDWGTGGRSAAGVTITPETALESTTVWAAVRMISSTLATLPLQTFRHVDGGKERAREHAAYRLLHDRPNPEMSSFVWRETMAAHLLLFGNHYSEIERNEKGDPIALWPVHPTSVRTERMAGRKFYIVRVGTEEVTLPADDVLHVPGFSLDGCTGLMPVNIARNALGLSKATEEYGSAFFGNGATPGGILSAPGKLGPDARENLRASWNGDHRGLSNAQRVAILEGGMQWQPMGVPPEHAQFLETRKFSVSEIARIFLIPPHLIGDLERATFSNIEHQAIQYVTHCIEPWTRRIEQEINFKLFNDPSHFAEFVLEGLLRGDTAARADWYTKMAGLGVYSINEIRERENLNRIPDGDKRFVPLNMVELGQPVPGEEGDDDGV
jgi:HK97 family phage portal protein